MKECSTRRECVMLNEEESSALLFFCTVIS